MIRDGYSYDLKRIRKDSKVVEKEYKSDLFISLLRVLNNYVHENNYEYFAYLRDPYSFLFCFHPELIKEIKAEGTDWEQVLSCQEVYDAINEGTTEGLKLDDESREILEYLQTLKIRINEEKLLKNLIKNRDISEKNVMDTWILQPNPEAISFAIGSARAELETITPVIGVPVRLMTTTSKRNKIRFPCVVEEKLVGERAQIHKTADKYIIFDKNGEILKEKPLNLGDLGDFGKFLTQNGEIIAPNQANYVIDGIICGENETKIFDILALNDVWYNQRPLEERLNHLWRFYPNTIERQIAWNWTQLNQITEEMEDFVVKNLNRPYDPTLRDAWISTEVDTALLQVSNIKHHANETFLVSKEGTPIFRIGVKLEEDLLKRTVEVKKNGKVIKILNSAYLPDGLDEIYMKWNIKRKEGMKVGMCEWQNVNKFI